MRSRTELVTTTFVDSEEDNSDDDDDSEEDWRPTASNKNGKKLKQSYQHPTQQQQQQQKSSGGNGGNGSNSILARKGRKRKGSSSMSGNSKTSAKRRNDTDNDFDDLDDTHDISDDIIDEDFDSLDGPAMEEIAGPSSQKKTSAIQIKKQFSENKSTSSVNDTNSHNRSLSSQDDDTIDVLIYVKDLMGDYEKNQRLCLWRRDDSNLLQKYIRVKTSFDEFLFTSSSVYSSWDDKRVTDFLNIRVQSLDTSNRRVKIKDLKELAKLAQQAKDCINSEQKKGDRKADLEFKIDFERKAEVANPSNETNKPIDNGNGNMKNVEKQENKKTFPNTARILEKMHQQATIDEDREIEFDYDDDDDEEVEEEDDEEEDEGDLEADDDDDDDADDDIEEDDAEDEILENDD